MLKILQLIPNMQVGGAEKFVYELSIQLNKDEDIRCDIATLYPIDSKNTYKLSDDMYVGDLGKKMGLDLRCQWKVYKLVKKNKYNVVHAHINAILYILLSVILNPKVKYIATIHSDAQYEAPTRIERIVRMFLFKICGVQPVTISEESNKSFKKIYKMTAPIIYNGVSNYSMPRLEQDGYRTGEAIVFVHSASCQPIKNQILLFSAFQKLSQEFSNVKLLWFGNNLAYKELFTELSAFLSEHIIYCGCVNNMQEYLAKADAICLSSLKEGMPMCIIEAFSVGCIPIVTPAGGCINMISDGINGFISRSFNVDDYYQVLKEFVCMSKDRLNEMRNSCIESFNNYTIEKCARYYTDLYINK